MSWKSVALYDGRVRGNAITEFARNAATEDGYTANARRFAADDFAFAPAPSWSDDYDYTYLSYPMGSGPDQDGTPLVVFYVGATEKLTVLSESGGTLSLENATSYSALPGASGTITYQPKCASVHHGLIVVTANTLVSGVSKYVTVFHSQDRGLTWDRVQDIGGNYYVPEISGTGAFVAASRVGWWSGAQAFPVGGIHDNGNYNKLACWFAGTDYLGRNVSDEPEGGQAFLFRATRASESSAWVVEEMRLMYEEWGAGTAVHAHCAAVMSGGLAIVFGDTDFGSHVAFAEFDLSNYKTATITATKNWHGFASPNKTDQKKSPQPVCAVPGPDGSTLFSSDLTCENILRLEDAESAAVDAEWSALQSSPRDTPTGSQYNGYTSLALKWYPGKGYYHGGYETLEINPNQFRHFSPDGANWALVPSDSGGFRGGLIAGDYLVVLNNTTKKMSLTALPTIKKQKPLIVAPGGTNILDFSNVRDAQGGNVRRTVSYSDGGGYVYDDDGTSVPGAPDVAPPRDGVLVEYTTIGTTTYDSGLEYTQASGETLDSQYAMALDLWVYNLSNDSALRFTPTWGAGNLTAAHIPQKGFTWHANDQWLPCTRSGAATTPGVDRGRVNAWCGLAYDKPNNSRMLVCYAGLYLSAVAGVSEPLPWPCPMDKAAKPNEVEKITTLSPSSAWSIAAILRRPLNSFLADNPLFTAYADATNYVEVIWDESAENIVLTPTVAAVAGTTITLNIGEWERELPLYLILSDDGSAATAMEASAWSMQSGIIHGSAATTSLALPLQEIKLCNSDETEVGNIEVVAVAYDVQATNQASRETLLKNLDFLNYAARSLNIDPNLECHLKADETTGIYLEDSSGNNNRGQCISSPVDDTQWLTDGKFKGACRRDSSGQINIPHSENLTGTVYTVAFWFRFPAAPGSTIRVVAKYNGALTRQYTIFMQATRRLSFSTRGTGGTVEKLGATVLSVDTWHHIAMTCDGTNIYGYVDGVLETGPWDVTGKIGTDTNPVYLFNSPVIESDVDDFRYYSRFSTASEILDLASNPFSNVDILDPAMLKPGLVDGSNLKPSLVTASYGGGIPTYPEEIKPGLRDGDNLKPSLVDADGNLKPSLLR